MNREMMEDILDIAVLLARRSVEMALAAMVIWAPIVLLMWRG